MKTVIALVLATLALGACSSGSSSNSSCPDGGKCANGGSGGAKGGAGGTGGAGNTTSGGGTGNAPSGGGVGNAPSGGGTGNVPSGGGGAGNTSGGGGTGNVSSGGGTGGGAVCNAVGGTPGSCTPSSPLDTCENCIADNCCSERQTCLATNPNDPCGWGGPAGYISEASCFQQCFKKQLAQGATVDQAHAVCSSTCITPGCTTISPATDALMKCLESFCLSGCLT